MKSLSDALKKMGNVTSQENMETSSTTEADFSGPCRICGQQPSYCGGLGMVRYDVPVGDPRFGKLFRCPHNPVEHDEGRQQKLREISNLSAFVDKSFETFETELSMHKEDERRSLVLALKASRQFADRPEGWLLLEGSYGCGKTHLAAAIGQQRLAHGDLVLFITVPDLLDHLRAAYGPSSETGYDETFDRIRNADLLILDDLGVENPSPWAQEKLFQLLNHRYTQSMPTVITTNADLDRLDGRIRSRLLDINLIHRVLITAPDFRSLVQNQHNQLESNLKHYEDMTFETFDVYQHVTPEEQQNLEKVVRAAYDYAQRPQGWLLLVGHYGCGKTHLAAAIALHRRDLGEPVMFLTVPDLLDYLRMTYNARTPVSYEQRFNAVRNVPLLVIDDLGTENATSWAKEKLFQLLDYRYVTRLPTVITTSREMEQLDERLQSRLMDDRSCAMFAITTRSYARRRRNKR